jgi:trans-aconitate methyltransferase
MAAIFDPTTAPAVTLNARNADAYEQVMGQWSRRLAPLLMQFGGLADGDRVVDVGCGTGSLTSVRFQPPPAGHAGLDCRAARRTHRRRPCRCG